MSFSRASFSVESPNSPAIPGETKPRLNRNIKNGKPLTSLKRINSLYENYLHGRTIAGKNAPVFGYRPVIDGMGNVGPFNWITWGIFHERFVNVASGLVQLGLSSKSKIGIMMPNRIEWVLTEFAGYYQNLITVALYEAFNQESLVSVIHETQLSAIVCTNDNARKLLEAIDSQTTLRTFIVVDTISNDVAILAKDNGLNVCMFRSVEDAGAKNSLVPERLPGLDDIATIIYTSGTSGSTKGVILTHKNILATITSISMLIDLKDVVPIGPSDCSMGFLPLTHCLGRAVMHIMISRGCMTAFPRSDPTKLIDDLKDLKPTIFVGVPRLFNRIQDRVISAVKSKGGLPSALFQYAVNTKKANLRHGQINHWLWDRVIFKPLRDKFGGKLKLIVSGSAPISPTVLEFLQCCFSCSVVEGYGLTETMGPVCITLIDDVEPGNIGAPIPCAMAKLVSVPEMGYTVEDDPYPRGELMIKGASVASGYYNRPEESSKSFTEDGWLHTGDIAKLDSLGRFHIIDRKKNIFKLSQGVYITPERIENIYMDHFIVNQAFVYGNPLQSYLVGIIVPDEEFLQMFLENKGIIPSDIQVDFEQLCNDKRVRNAVITELDSWGRAHNLVGYENPKNIILSATSLESFGLLTPTFKLRRQEATKYFKETLENLYDEHERNDKE